MPHNDWKRLGFIAPLFGLAGTVVGMGKAFRIIYHAKEQPRVSELMEPMISALVTTMVAMIVGLAILALLRKTKS